MHASRVFLFAIACGSLGLAAESEIRLAEAVDAEDLQAVNQLLQSGADVKAKDRYGFTPLYFACDHANAAIAEKLLQAGADPNAADANGETPLIAATRSGGIDVVKILLAHGAVVNAKDTGTQQTALMWAVRSNHPEIAQLLMERGAEVNARTRTAAVPPRRPPNAGGGSHGAGIVRGGWPDRGSRDATPGGMSALLYAARDGRMEIARSLVAAKADANQAEANGITPLLMAILNDHLELSKLLFEKGADVNAADWWGRTPLFVAVDVRDREYSRTGEQGIDRGAWLEFVKALLDRGAKVNAQTKEVPPIRRWVMPISDVSWVDFTGQTPFLRAALSGDVTVMRMLLEKGADPNIPTNSKTTALMAAAGMNWSVGQTYTESKEGLLDAVKLCLEKGADVNAANTMGITAAMAAANRGSDEILEFLVGKGARLDAKDKEGRTPLVWAGGIFLATTPPEEKPSTIALIKRLSK